MLSLANTDSAVKPVDIQQLKDESARVVTRYRALTLVAESLARAVAVRLERPIVAMDDLPPAERRWSRDTAKELIEIFELATGATEDPEAIHQDIAVQNQGERELESELGRQRSRARVAAIGLGHEDMGGWHDAAPDAPAHEISVCARCRREAQLVIVDTAPPRVEIVGPAVKEPCLLIATGPAVEVQ